jgi:hypothetical protein
MKDKQTQSGLQKTQIEKAESPSKVSERNDLGPNKTIPNDDFDRLALEIAYDETRALLDRALKWMRNEGTLDTDWTEAVERHLGVTLTTDSETDKVAEIHELSEIFYERMVDLIAANQTARAAIPCRAREIFLAVHRVQDRKGKL